MTLLLCVGVRWNGWVCVNSETRFFLKYSVQFFRDAVCVVNEFILPFNLWMLSGVQTLLSGFFRGNGIGVGAVFIPRLSCATLVSQSLQIFKSELSLQRANSACSLHRSLPSVRSSVFRCEETRLQTVFHFLWSFPNSYSGRLFSTQLNLRLCHLVR